jgi:hypothetical protein
MLRIYCLLHRASSTRLENRSTCTKHMCRNSTETKFMFVGFHMSSIMFMYCFSPGRQTPGWRCAAPAQTQAQGVQPPPASKNMLTSDFLHFSPSCCGCTACSTGAQTPVWEKRSTCPKTGVRVQPQALLFPSPFLAFDIFTIMLQMYRLALTGARTPGWRTSAPAPTQAPGFNPISSENQIAEENIRDVCHHVANVMPAPQGLKHQAREPLHLSQHRRQGSAPNTFVSQSLTCFLYRHHNVADVLLAPQGCKTKLEKRSTCAVNKCAWVQPPPARNNKSLGRSFAFLSVMCG